MKDFLKWGLVLGGVGYFFFREQIAAAAAGVTAPVSASSPAAPASPPPVTTGTKELIAAAAKSDPAYRSNGGRLSAYQWNFYYTAVRNVAAPSPESLGLDGSMLLSIDEYWTAASTRGGLSGARPQLRGVRPRRSLAAQAWGM